VSSCYSLRDHRLARLKRSSSVWQELKFIPVPVFFIPVAAVLGAVLFVNFGPDLTKRQSSPLPAPTVDTGLRKPTTAVPAQRTVGIAPTAPAARSHYASSEGTDGSAQLGYPQPDEAAQQSGKKPQPRTGQGASGRASRDSRYSAAYAQTGPNGRSTAEGTLGPH